MDDGVVLVADSCNMTVEYSIFESNIVGHDGGAIHVYDDSNITVIQKILVPLTVNYY